MQVLFSITNKKNYAMAGWFCDKDPLEPSTSVLHKDHHREATAKSKTRVRSCTSLLKAHDLVLPCNKYEKWVNQI